MKNKEIKKGEIIIYKSAKGPEIEVKFEAETIWLTQEKMSQLFNIERSVITKHLKNIFESGELSEKSNVQKMHIANSDKPVTFYNLDAIISVGYRVNSKMATQFRIWATRTLKNYLVKGYVINEKRFLKAENKFKELQETISFLRQKSKLKLLEGQEQEIFDLLSNYSHTLTLLDKYDKNELVLQKKGRGKFVLKYENTKIIIDEIKKDLIGKKEASDLFGQEHENKLKGILGNLYQSLGGKEVYPSIEEKAAHLLYFIEKDHAFVDGNKRIGSFLFIYFLDKNDYLYRDSGEKKINDNALVSLVLLVAISEPREKDMMIKIITNLIGV